MSGLRDEGAGPPPRAVVGLEVVDEVWTTWTVSSAAVVLHRTGDPVRVTAVVLLELRDHVGTGGRAVRTVGAGSTVYDSSTGASRRGDSTRRSPGAQGSAPLPRGSGALLP